MSLQAVICTQRGVYGDVDVVVDDPACIEDGKVNRQHQRRLIHHTSTNLPTTGARRLRSSASYALVKRLFLPRVPTVLHGRKRLAQEIRTSSRHAQY